MKQCFSTIKTWQPPHFYIKPPFSGLSHLSSKNIDAHTLPPPKPQVTQFLKIPTPRFNKGVSNYGGRVHFSPKKGRDW